MHFYYEPIVRDWAINSFEEATYISDASFHRRIIETHTF